MFKVVSIEQLRQETATYDKLDGKNFTLQPDFSSGGGDRCYFHVARNRLSGRIIGYIQYRVENETNEAKCHAHICHLEVLEPYRQGGFATRLVIAAQDYLKRMFDPEYIITHIPRRVEMLYLFRKKLGYQLHDLDDENDAFVMIKMLKENTMHSWEITGNVEG
ncbi:N-terminal acetyltransferase A complex catalytic subunit NAA10 [Trifolium repens]|nr:N-terminal acetyltransferase A complex catalytic subunit NAA10 [Trifolium repens]